jgi:hypothetical protein
MGTSPLFWIVDGLAVLAVSALTIYSAVARKGKGRFLCDDCRFNAPEKCKKVERPRATVCSSYRSDQIREVERVKNPSKAQAGPALSTGQNAEQSIDIRAPEQTLANDSDQTIPKPNSNG